MPKKSNAEKVWSDKLPKILKPVGCSFTDDEWNDFSSFFPVNGWDAYPPEPDKTGDIIRKMMENKAIKYNDVVSQNKCLLCGEVTDGHSSHYRKDLGLCVSCCQSVFHVRRCKRNRLVIDPASGKEMKEWERDKTYAKCAICGNEGIFNVALCLCKRCSSRAANQRARNTAENIKPTELGVKYVTVRYQDFAKEMFPDGLKDAAKVKLVRQDMGYGIR